MDAKPTVLYHTEQAAKTRQEILRTSMDVALEGLGWPAPDRVHWV
jgi:hypothetical protein